MAGQRDRTTGLRRGWTTGACAAGAVKAALSGLWCGTIPGRVGLTLPGGETPEFEVVNPVEGEGWVEVGIIKDAGDDPDVTHGAEIRARVEEGGDGVTFAAGIGVGRVTKAGLPIPVGEPAINPKPREMIVGVVEELAATYSKRSDIKVTVSVPTGEALATKTWNPRLGIVGGISILGTTGIVKPFSCAAWIASIHRGIDVVRAEGLTHVAGCTGSTSEKAVQALHGLADHAMLDMGDFVGGMIKYLRRHPVERLTIGGGLGKLSKLGQGARDLHSGRSQVDFDALAHWVGDDRLRAANTALEAFEIAGEPLAKEIATRALAGALSIFDGVGVPDQLDVVLIDRSGAVLAQAAHS